MGRSFKPHYRNILAKRELAEFDLHQNFAPDLKDALLLIRQAWHAVTQTTIQNCFLHKGLLAGPRAPDDDLADPLDSLADTLRSNPSMQGFTADAVVDFDKGEPTGEHLSVTDIVELLSEEVVSPETENDTTSSSTPISFRTANQDIDSLISYFAQAQSDSTAEAAIPPLLSVKSILDKKAVVSPHQSDIRSFLSAPIQH